MENSSKQNITSEVLEKIKRDEIQMKSRFYFFVRIATIIILAVGILLALIFFVSFLVFSFEIGGRFFPWEFLVLDIVLLYCLEYMLRYFHFAYRIPVISLGFILVIITFLAAYLVTLTPLHPLLMRRADEKRLPFMGNYYEHERPSLYRGNVYQLGNRN